MAERHLDFRTAKEVFRRVARLEEDRSGAADFLIAGKEALILTKYTRAYFPISEDFSYEFSGKATEYLSLRSNKSVAHHGPHYARTWSPSLEDFGPTSSKPLSWYFQEFSALKDPKHLFLIDTSRYYTRKREYLKRRAIEDILTRIRQRGLNPRECVVWEGPGLGEDFWCYVAGLLLRRKGYLVTDYNLGAGDISAYYIPDYSKELGDTGLPAGAFLEELEMLPIDGERANIIQEGEAELVLVEAESTDKRTKSPSSGAGVGQVLEFLDRPPWYYTHAFVTGPYCEPGDISEEFIGLISCDEGGNALFHRGKRYRRTLDEAVRKIKDLIKSRLLRNFTFEERCEMIGGRPSNPADYYEKLISLDLEKVLDLLGPRMRHQ